MPMFDFKCKKCDTVYEALIRSIAIDVPLCPHCGATEEDQIQQVSAPKLFKGLPMGNGTFSKKSKTRPT
jgi:putative FmdB family regulatory protein